MPAPMSTRRRLLRAALAFWLPHGALFLRTSLPDDELPTDFLLRLLETPA